MIHGAGSQAVYHSISRCDGHSGWVASRPSSHPVSLEKPQCVRRDAHGGAATGAGCTWGCPFSQDVISSPGAQVFLFNKVIAIQLAHGDPFCNISTASLPQHLPKLSPRRVHASMFLTGGLIKAPATAVELWPPGSSPPTSAPLLNARERCAVNPPSVPSFAGAWTSCGHCGGQ